MVPRPDVGAPLPAVVSDEHRVLLAYVLSEQDPNWDGTYAKPVSSDTPDQPVVVVRFDGPYCHTFGPPNDEAFTGHPLAHRGLKRYSVSEVHHSSWIQSLARMNSVHPYHRAAHFTGFRHYIFAFHDSTFECVARGLQFDVHRGSMRSVVSEMAAALGNHAV